MDLHIAEHLRNLDDEDKCYLYDQITEFKDIILNGTTIHSQTNFLKHDERREYWASMNDLNTILAHDDLDDFKQYLSKHPCNHIKHPYFKYEFALNYSDTQLPGLQIIDYAAYSNAISIFHYLYELGNTSDYMADYAIAGNANRIVAFLAELKYHKLKISRYQVHRCYNFQFLDFLREKAIVNSELNFNFLKTWLDAKNFYLFTPNFLKINFESDANLNDLIFGIFSTECIPYIHFLHENNLLPEKPNLSRLVFLLNEVIQAGHTISFTILIEKYESLLFPSYLSDILQQSCRFGQFYMVKMLLAYGKNVIDFGFNSDPTFDGTPLHVACLKGYLSIMELLLGQQGIPINSVDSQGNTPLLIPMLTLINRIPDEFLPSVSNNSQQLLLLMLQVFSIDENYRRCELYSLILKLFARIIPQDALFLLNEGILDDLYIFEAVNKQIATDIFDKLVEYITTNEVQEFHQSIEELGSFIREFYDDEETINWHRKYPLIINQWHITTIF